MELFREAESDQTGQTGHTTYYFYCCFQWFLNGLCLSRFWEGRCGQQRHRVTPRVRRTSAISRCWFFLCAAVFEQNLWNAVWSKAGDDRRCLILDNSFFRWTGAVTATNWHRSILSDQRNQRFLPLKWWHARNAQIAWTCEEDHQKHQNEGHAARRWLGDLKLDFAPGDTGNHRDLGTASR